MARRQVTIPPFRTPSGVLLQATVEIALVDALDRELLGIVLSSGEPVVYEESAVSSDADQFLELTVTENISPWSQYRVRVTVEGLIRNYWAQVPAGGVAMTWVELVAGGSPTDPAEISALLLHLADLVEQHLSEDERAALSAASAPDASNALATMADVVSASASDIHTFVSAPASPTASGTAGQWAWSSPFLYFCVATDVWVRTVPARTW